MSEKLRNSALIAVLLAVGIAVPAGAQMAPGVRAQGLAGAFTGVADDASAVYWNPAGIAVGSLVSGVIDFGETTQLPGAAQIGPGTRDTTGMVAFSATALGFAYYHLATYTAGTAEPAGVGPDGREEVGRSVHAVVTGVIGVSLLQSLSEHIVVGVTPKWVRGGVRDGVSTERDINAALDSAAALEGPTSTKFDVDASVMMHANRFRFGVTGRNLTTPEFLVNGVDGAVVEIDRQVRIGGAWGSGWSGLSRVIVAVDGDVTTQQSATGDRRDLAAGVETWWLKHRIGVRGGARRSTVGESRSVFAGGVSAGVTAGLFVDAQLTRGRDDQRGWSVGARMAF